MEKIQASIGDSDKIAIEKLRSLVADYVTPDFNDFDFLRWLQGHDYDYDIIVPLLIQHFRVMRSYDFKNSSHHNEIMAKYWPEGWIGVTTGLDDSFIFIDCIGPMDGEGILKSISIYDVVLYKLNSIERKMMTAIRGHERDTGRRSGVLVLQDMENAPLNPTTLSMLAGPYRLLAKLLTEHYAEILSHFIIVNAPSFVQILWRLVKPALPEKTKRKIFILGSDWKTELSNYIHPDSLPVHWGGTMVDENNDPKYGSKVVIPRKVPSDHYWIRSESHPKPDQMKSLTIPAGRWCTVTQHVSKPDSVLKWYFMVSTDFGFGVFYIGTEDASEEETEKFEMVYPQFRLLWGGHYRPEIDQIPCKRPGFYKLWFGNETSWITKLKIDYFVQVLDH